MAWPPVLQINMASLVPRAKWLPCSVIATAPNQWCDWFVLYGMRIVLQTQSFFRALVYFSSNRSLGMGDVIRPLICFPTTKPSPCLNGVDFGAVFAMDLVHSPCSFLLSPLVLGDKELVSEAQTIHH